MENTHIIEQLIQNKGSALLGIDGIIDEVWELVATRSSPDVFAKMSHMMDLGNAITQRKTGGMAIERVLKRRISGGFVCNTGRAVAKLGQTTTLLGFFGEKTHDPIFHEFHNLATLISLGPSIYNHILEFSDGKLMMPHLHNLFQLSWRNVVEFLGQARIDELLNVDIVGLGYWSNMHDFESILHGVVDSCVQSNRCKCIFHDFANINKRTSEALQQALLTLEQENQRLPQILSLNEHEGGILARHFGLSYPEDVNTPASGNHVYDTVCKLRACIGIEELIIHTSHYAVLATASQGNAVSSQTYFENPVKTTGAGDAFNGGYMVSKIIDLSPIDRLILSNAITYSYVSTGNTPTLEVLSESLRKSKISK